MLREGGGGLAREGAAALEARRLGARPAGRALCAALVDCWREAVGEEEGPTYPSSSPRKRIDWLLRARGSQWRTESARVVPTAASDHCAVVFELTRMR